MAMAPRQRILLWAGVGLLALDAWWMAGHWGGDVATLSVIDAVGVLAPFLASTACFARSRTEEGRMATAWLLLGAGTMAWTCGELYWVFDELVLQAGTPVGDRSLPFPSPADIGYVLFLVLAAAALVLLPSRLWTRGARLRLSLDAALIAAGLLAIAWPLLLSDLVAALTGRLEVAGLLGFLYPLGDLVLITLALLAGTYAAHHERRTRLLLLAGIGVLGVTDLLFWIGDVNSTYASGGPLDLGWPAGFILVALAAAEGGPRAADLRLAGDRPPAVVHALPVLPGALAGAMAAGLVVGPRGMDAVSALLVVAVAGLAVARQLAWRAESRHWGGPAGGAVPPSR